MSRTSVPRRTNKSAHLLFGHRTVNKYQHPRLTQRQIDLRHPPPRWPDSSLIHCRQLTYTQGLPCIRMVVGLTDPPLHPSRPPRQQAYCRTIALELLRATTPDATVQRRRLSELSRDNRQTPRHPHATSDTLNPLTMTRNSHPRLPRRNLPALLQRARWTLSRKQTSVSSDAARLPTLLLRSLRSARS
jgi:hypothetical protein